MFVLVACGFAASREARKISWKTEVAEVPYVSLAPVVTPVARRSILTQVCETFHLQAAHARWCFILVFASFQFRDLDVHVRQIILYGFMGLLSVGSLRLRFRTCVFLVRYGTIRYDTLRKNFVIQIN
jgi:hypothetical protein